jgi:C-terminal processing protease CtpA/Prc
MKEPLGVTCAVVDGKAEVATIAPESPVKAAGVSVRDLLTHVNGFSLSQRTPEGRRSTRSFSFLDFGDETRLRVNDFCSDAIQVMLSTEFPKSVTFLRNENSIIDYTNEDVEGEFVVTVRAL